MSEQNTPQNPHLSDEFAGGAGFEVEGVNQENEQGGQGEARTQPKTTSKRSKSDEMRRNFSAVFGHGVGKISLIFVAVIVIIGFALGYRGLTSKSTEVSSNSEVDVPDAPPPSVEVGAISKKEAERRAQRAALEAQEAAARGQTYQPGFDTEIVDNTKQPLPSGATQFNLPIQTGSNNTPSPQVGAAATVNITVPTGQATANQAGAAPQVSQYQSQGQNAQAEQQARQRLEQELKQAQAERDRYVEEIKEQVLKQAQSLFGEAGQGGLNAQGSYSTVNYYPVNRNNGGGDGQGSAGGGTATGPLPGITHTDRDTLGDPNGKLLIKAGNMMYATLDSEVNTDDGDDVIATIRGGKWDGSKIIGRIEQGRNNIRLKFSMMAPQDGRPTMRINAVALREEDAKQGVADDIDHHTFERYTSLAVASLLSGYGRAYSTPVGTTVISPGGTISTTTTEPTDKRVIGMAVGEMGQAMAQEIGRGFNRPPTYSTPAQKGFGLFFMQDVYEQTK
jgi:intracellular multiplication protein IcmE